MPAIGICLSQLQRFNQNVFVIFEKRLVFQIRLSLLDRLDRIAREHALIGQLFWPKSRLITKQNVKKLQVVDMLPENHHAHRERGC